MDDEHVELQTETYRELETDPATEIDASMVSLRDPATGQLFAVSRASMEAALSA